MDIAKFKKQPVLGILRGIEAVILEPLIETIIDSGLKTIEITMNTPDAPRLIRKAVTISKKQLTIGAGTVLDMKSLNSALSCGATFIVMPVIVDKVLAYCLKNKIPVFPGALTPQEIYTAWQKGATMVKVFPAKFFGAEYFKEIKAPFNEIELLACGGVTPENMKAYFANGASAVSFGANVFKREWLAAADFKNIRKYIERYLNQNFSLNMI